MVATFYFKTEANPGAKTTGWTWVETEINNPANATDNKRLINIGDAWKAEVLQKINIGDVWKTIVGEQINIGDSWKTIYEP